MEIEVVGLGDGSEILDEFDSKLLTLQKKMWHEVVKVIRPFFLFLKTFDLHNVHKMFAIMLDLRFKFLRIVENYVGHGATIRLASKYDAKAMIPLLMACFDQLNVFIPKHVQLLLMCFLSLKKKNVICLVLEHPWTNPFMLLLLKNFLYLWGYLSLHLHVQILYFSGGAMKTNFQMLVF